MSAASRSMPKSFLLVVTLLVAPAVATSARAQNLDSDLASWMSYAPDSVSLAALTIPGSHDSGALYEPVAGTAICQTLSIREQLDIGVRYLDIRLRQYGNSLLVHHGSVYQHQNFDDVLQQVTAFLQANPSESVVMEVSSESTPANNSETYEQTFLRYALAPAYAPYWWRHTYVPRLGEVRGKIVLLRRFAGAAGSIDGIDTTRWSDNAEFSVTDTRSISVVVQDYYQVSVTTNDHKWNVITELLNRAAADTTGTWYLDFTSGVRNPLGIPDVPGVARDIDARLNAFFGSDTRHFIHYGTVISDFVDKPMVQAELRHYFE